MRSSRLVKRRALTPTDRVTLRCGGRSLANVTALNFAPDRGRQGELSGVDGSKLEFIETDAGAGINGAMTRMKN